MIDLMAGRLRLAFGRLRALLFYRRAVARFLRSRHLSLVLRYHSIGEADRVADYVSPGISIDPQRFAEHVALLTSRFDVIDLDEVLHRARGGRPAHSRPGVAITFDDGYQDNFEHALPILQRHGATATFYIVAGSVAPALPVWTARLRHLLQKTRGPNGSCPLPLSAKRSSPHFAEEASAELTRHLRGLSAAKRERAVQDLADWAGVAYDQAGVMMDEDQIRGMSRAGMTIGAHTVTHPLLPAIPVDEAREEIVESGKILSRIIGKRVIHFSYPNPGGGLHYDPTVRDLVREAGYRSSATSIGGLVGPGSDALALPRIGVNAGRLERLLFRTIDKAAPILANRG